MVVAGRNITREWDFALESARKPESKPFSIHFPFEQRLYRFQGLAQPVALHEAAAYAGVTTTAPPISRERIINTLNKPLKLGELDLFVNIVSLPNCSII